jgi:hypothetical protein
MTAASAQAEPYKQGHVKFSSKSMDTPVRLDRKVNGLIRVSQPPPLNATIWPATRAYQRPITRLAPVRSEPGCRNEQR